jgi:hypothetical protein
MQPGGSGWGVDDVDDAATRLGTRGSPGPLVMIRTLSAQSDALQAHNVLESPLLRLMGPLHWAACRRLPLCRTGGCW